jgi:hypothetical protein
MIQRKRAHGIRWHNAGGYCLQIDAPTTTPLLGLRLFAAWRLARQFAQFA